MTRISPLACAKILMHATKYAHCDVVGAVLVAEGQVVDVVPLSHNPLTAVITDSGLAVAERLAKARGARLAGIYVGRGTAKEDVLGTVHAKLADAVQAHAGAAHAFVLQISRTLLSKPGAFPLQRFTKKASGSWTVVDSQSADALEALDGAAFASVERAMEPAVASRVVDYEDMLALPSLDLSNAFAGELV